MDACLRRNEPGGDLNKTPSPSYGEGAMGVRSLIPFLHILGYGLDDLTFNVPDNDFQRHFAGQ